MAYINQDMKKKLAPGIREVLKKYGVSGTISINDHRTLTVTLKKGRLDIIGDANKNARPDWTGLAPRKIENHFDVNVFYIKDNFDGEVRDFLLELHRAMNASKDESVINWDNSDIQTDYFDIGWHTSIKVGTYTKPYIYHE